MIRLETPRLILRDYRPEDLADCFRIKSDPEVMYYLQDLRLDTLEEARQDLEGILLDLQGQDRRFYFLRTELKDTHEQVGSIGYTVMADTPAGKLVHAGYFSHKCFWGKGYMTEALRRLIEFAFTEGNVYRITTGCLGENAGSERVMQHCGMIREAVRTDWEWHDGRMKDRHEYRLLRREWEQQNR